MMKSRERVMAALAGAPVDRPPVSFWGHFYHRESTARDLADATIEFQHAYAWDWIKLNPRKHYHVEPWGVRYRYSGRPGEKPALAEWPVRTAEDWRAIREVASDASAFAEQIEAVRLVRRAIPADVPLIETVFTPLAVLGEMTEHPETLRDHLRETPDLVRGALEAVTRTFEGVVPRLLDAGADGIFFATVDWGTRDLLSAEDLRSWSRPYDLRVLARAAGAPFNVLHVCRRNALLYDFADYPVHAFSWASSDPTNPGLRAALERLPGAVMGGVAHEGAVVSGGPEDVLAELRAGFEATGGRRWLVAPTCSIPPAARPDNLRAIRDAVESMMSHGRAP